MQPHLVTLTTDFGAADWFVGVMKGVILSLAPRAVLVDLTHGIPPGDIRAGAFALAAACPSFTRPSIHVAVVDPGVGGPRLPIAIRTNRHIFIGPDNGLLSLALQQETIRDIRQIASPDWMVPSPSHTFHGRDIFAPAAAHLAAGRSFRGIGPRLPNFHKLPFPQPTRTGARTMSGQIVYVDRFGNALTNLPNDWVPTVPSTCRIQTGSSRTVFPVLDHYGAVAPGRPVAVPGSTGHLELSINQGNAARQLRLHVGARVVWKEQTSALRDSKRRHPKPSCSEQDG